MKVLHYNIYNGFNDDADCISRFSAFLKTVDADVLLLNEYRQSELLDDALQANGYSHSCISTFEKSANLAAIFSRRAFDQIVHVSDGMRLVWVRVSGLNLIAYHAFPTGVQTVVAEVETIGQLIKDAGPALLCGDLNSIARVDSMELAYEELPPAATERYSIEGELSHAAIDGLLQMGFKDCELLIGQPTVPTAIYRKHELGSSLRLDYALVRDLHVDDIQILRGPPLDTISDHFPLLITGLAN